MSICWCDIEDLIRTILLIFQGVHENLDFIYSQRGRPLIVVDGYLYRKNRAAYWRCIRCTKYRCKSRLILRPDREPVCIEKHSHGPEKEKIEWGRKVRSTVSFESAEEDNQPPAKKVVTFQLNPLSEIGDNSN